MPIPCRNLAKCVGLITDSVRKEGGGAGEEAQCTVLHKEIPER